MSERQAQLEAIVGAVSRETLLKLDSFEAAFLKWNKVTNLVAASTASDIWSRHILDSAQLVPIGRHAQTWLDLGSGGGFPGLIVSILTADSGATTHLVESNRKKAAFLQSIVGLLSLPAKVHARRIDAVAVSHVDVVTARALAPLGLLFGYAERWIGDGAKALFHKGREYRRELTESADIWDAMLLEHPSLIDPESVILEVRSLRRR
jgi:16S rRNA (guanine527-N7)-methyltransferase